MPSIYLFLLGLVMTSVVANNITTSQNFTSSEASDVVINDPEVNKTTTVSITKDILTIPVTTQSMNASDNNTGITPEMSKGNENAVVSTTVSIKLSPTPTPRNEKTASTTKTNPTTTTKDTPKTTPKAGKSTAGDRTGIIIVVIIVLVIFGFGVACFVARKRGRRYSVDFASRPDENVPLSVVDPELHVESAPQNGLKTFESTETAATEPKGPEVAPETQEQKKEEAATSAAASSAEPAAPPEAPAAAQPPESSEEKPNVDDTKQSSSAPVEPLAEEKTDDEGTVSNKTSVESLKETNENNSNNSGFSPRRDRQKNNTFWEVCVECPV